MLLQSMYRAKEKGYRAKVSVDKLYVDGKLYSIDTLNSLPEDINQAKLYVKIKEDCHYVGKTFNFLSISRIHFQGESYDL